MAKHRQGKVLLFLYAFSGKGDSQIPQRDPPVSLIHVIEDFSKPLEDPGSGPEGNPVHKGKYEISIGIPMLGWGFHFIHSHPILTLRNSSNFF
jgi:hypothetical protein